MRIEDPAGRDRTAGAVRIERVHDASLIRDVYARHPLIHPYGLADVRLFWDRSVWWRDARCPEAVVGVLDLPGSPIPVVYAISAAVEDPTRALVSQLARDGALGPRFVITGPRRLTDNVAPTHRTRWARDHVKLACTRPEMLPPPDPRVRLVGHDDLDQLHRLFDSDPSAGDFFHAGLLDDGWYRGIEEEDGTLLSVAGTHVVDAVSGVAALGNVATHPDARRRGLGRATVATLTRELLAAGLQAGLNVAVDNLGARALYEQLGFAWVLDYEEAELVARNAPEDRREDTRR